MKRLSIGIFGAGALGSMIGAYLSNDHDITLYGRSVHVDAINTNGLKVTGVLEEKTYGVKAISELNRGHFDLAVVGVKTYDTETLFLELQQSRVTFDLVASLQNGLKDEILFQRFGAKRTLGCVIDEAAKFPAPGHVHYSNQNVSFFGCYAKENCANKMAVAECLARSLSDVGLKTGLSEDMHVVTWYKFMLGVPGAVVPGALDLNAAQLFSGEHSSGLLLKALNESQVVAEQERIHLRKHPMLNGLFLTDDNGKREIIDRVAGILCQREDPPVASLVQDLRKRKSQTEAKDIIGKMLSIGTKHDVQMPVIKGCYQKILEKEAKNRYK